MGGKRGTTTQSVSIPPEVMARYKAVNSQAQSVAATPFQKYSTNPNDFVAGINQQQYAGIGGINQAANQAQPSIAYAQQGFTPEGFQQGVKGYMNPYLESAVASTRNQMQNVAGQQQAQMKGSAIGQGAFGGDRSNIGMGNLINQQNLALGQTIGGMENQGYQQAAQNYMGGLGQIGQLGLQGQQAALQGAQAQLGAGTLEQQTQQAGQTALYNQFLQQQAYPFQISQFLANIAMGTGANSGSTTTTSQPMPFFSDRRLKKNIERIGETDEGLPIHKFEYKGDPKGQKHIGLMADEVEQVHPEAVGTHKSGYKVVDYDRATSEGGAVLPQREGLGFADGGDVAAALNAINARQSSSPDSGGGINEGLAAAAQSIAPRTNVPQSVFYEPSYNPFSDPKYQPDLNGSNDFAGTGSDSGTRDNLRGSRGSGNGQNYNDHHGGPDSNPYPNTVNQDYSPSTGYGGGIGGFLGGLFGGGDSGVGGQEGQSMYASGGRAGYATDGYVMQQPNPYDPYGIENILARQQAMFANLERSHVPPSRQMSGGLGKGSRVPEGSLPVSQLKTAGSAPSLPDSILKQGLNAGEQVMSIGKDGRDLYKFFTEDPDKKAHGGLVADRHGYSLDGSVPDKDVDGSAVDELYSNQNTDATKRDILSKFDKNKLAEPGKPPTPTSQTGVGLGEAVSAAKFLLPFFLKDGGVAGYREHHDGAEGNVVGAATPAAEPYELTAAKDILRRREKFRAQPYYDTNALRGGYGTDEFTTAEGKVMPVTDKTVFTKEDAERDLGRRVPNFMERAKSQIGEDYWSKLTPDARAALTSVTYNYGSVPESVVAAARTGDMAAIGDAVYSRSSDNEGINAERRSEEARFINPTGEYNVAQYNPARTGTSGKDENEPTSILDKLFGPNKKRGVDSDRTTNTDMLLSILSGVGTMASSNSPYLGSALLQGIGGGAKTYAGLRNQESEMALRESEMLKNTMGLLNERFDPLRNGNFRDMWTGKEVGPDTRATIGMKMGLPESFFGGTSDQSQGLGAASSKAQTSAGAPTENKTPPKPGLVATPDAAENKTEALGAAVEPEPTTTTSSSDPTVSADADPAVSADAADPSPEEVIYNRIDQTPTVQAYKKNITSGQEKIKELTAKLAELDASLESAPSKFIPSIQAQASDIASQINSEKVLLGQNLEQYNQLRDRLAGPDITALTKTRELEAGLTPEIIAQQQVKNRAESVTKNNIEQEQGGAKYLQEYPANKQNIETLMNVYQKYDMNRLTDTKASVIGIAKELPGLTALLRDKFGIDINSSGFQGAADTATKATIMQAIGMLSKTTDAQLNSAIESVADPSRGAGAKYTILIEQTAKLDQQRQAYEDFINRENKSESWPEFISNWQRDEDHLLENYEQAAAYKTPYFAGMSEADVDALKDSIKRPDEVFDEERKKGLPAFLKSRALEKGKGPDGRDLIKDKETGTIYDARTGLIIGGG